MKSPRSGRCFKKKSRTPVGRSSVRRKDEKRGRKKKTPVSTRPQRKTNGADRDYRKGLPKGRSRRTNALDRQETFRKLDWRASAFGGGGGGGSGGSGSGGSLTAVPRSLWQRRAFFAGYYRTSKYAFCVGSTTFRSPYDGCHIEYRTTISL